MNQVELDSTTFCSSWIKKFQIPNLIDGTRIAFFQAKKITGKEIVNPDPTEWQTFTI
jgi:hypothetical protein